MTLEDSEARVVIQKNITESFCVNITVGQDDAMSVILFNLILDYITKKIFISGRISSKTV
jgi:hypothetical protein